MSIGFVAESGPNSARTNAYLLDITADVYISTGPTGGPPDGHGARSDFQGPRGSGQRLRQSIADAAGGTFHYIRLNTSAIRQ